MNSTILQIMVMRKGRKRKLHVPVGKEIIHGSNRRNLPKKRGRPRDESKHNVPCDICGKVFKYFYQLKTHQKLHFGIKDFECEHCQLRFVQKGALVVHLRKHTGEKPFQCPYCPEAFKDKISLDSHTFKHTLQGSKCPECPSVFATPYAVKQHARQVHSQERPHVCQICGKGYKNRRDMARHIEGHDRRICSVCGKVFDTVYALKTHMHVYDKGPRCSLCNRLFKSEEELQAHAKLRGRAYQCELCCYSFNKAEFLSNHHRRNHWKVMGLEQLVWNFPPRPKKPKPMKKVRAPLPIVVPVDSGLPLVAPIQENTQLDMQEINAIQEVLVEKSESSIINETKEEILETLSDVDDGPFHDVLESDHGDAIDHTESDPDVKIEIESKPLPEEVFVKEELDEELAATHHHHSDQIEFELNELDVKVEDSSHDEDDDVPLAVLRLKLSREKNEAVSQNSEKTITRLDSTSEDDKPLRNNTDKGPNTNLRCGVCGKLYKSRTGFKSHQQIHAGIKNFHCKVCDSSFMTKGGLVAHLRTHTGEKAYKCSHCPARFRSRYMLTYHTFEHTKQGVQCYYCPKVLPTKPVFNRHLKTAHIKREPFRCHLCVRSFRNNVSLKAHIKKHGDQTCNACGEICKGREALKKHRKTVHRVVKKSATLICELCGQKYATITSLSIHRAKHKEHQRFKCDQCPKAFFFNGMLEDHKRVEHHGERLMCSVCGKLFKHLTDLRRHQLQHSKDKPFKCDQCPAAYRHPSGLYCHKAMHKKVVYPCDICGKEYRSSNGLLVHKRNHAEGSRFQCEICNRKFSQKAPMLKHMTIHTVDRQVKCVVCEQIFYRKVDLVIHQAKQHPNHPLIGKTIKIHTCNICGADFTKRHLLQQHADIHGSEYKFKCDMCENQKFKQMAGLRYHWKHFHRKQPAKRKMAKKTIDKADVTSDNDLITPLYEQVDDHFESEIRSAECGSSVFN
ncbi:zinc finger protein 135 isoform X2 [Aedes aegypti]|uniref:C2H2-type domain-containing protein n=1 Tax=Aedes aegypti TaxID=7159 RepID=A0A6I8U2D6_AEDAE|nr:zinc finger protein 135 isoform X2 [Aedes aegypti]